MIARTENTAETTDVWARLAAPLPPGVIAWRQDGRAVQRDGRYFARFVAYIEANTVRERLDGVVPGEWDLTLELLPALDAPATDETACTFKARLQILGVIREDVGTGRDYKQAATDAVISGGGTITHHHAVGREHRPWYDKERPDLFAAALGAAKRALDPQGLLNPGVLIDA